MLALTMVVCVISLIMLALSGVVCEILLIMLAFLWLYSSSYFIEIMYEHDRINY